MTEACLILYQGGLNERSGGEWAGAKEIVHADIKLANVFLAAPRPEDFEVYPTPQMADFGSAFITEKGDSNNPNDYVGIGTPLCCAPVSAPTLPEFLCQFASFAYYSRRSN